MVTEDYVSFETAKLLKEKGFPQEYDEYHSLVYNEKDYEDEYEVQRMVLQTIHVKAGTLSSYPIGVPEPKCYCPTLQMAMKWLRKEYNLHIRIGYWPINKTYYSEIMEVHNDNGFFTKEYPYSFSTYEYACEAAIKHCLEKLI